MLIYMLNNTNRNIVLHFVVVFASAFSRLKVQQLERLVENWMIGMHEVFNYSRPRLYLYKILNILLYCEVWCSANLRSNMLNFQARCATLLQCSLHQSISVLCQILPVKQIRLLEAEVWDAFDGLECSSKFMPWWLGAILFRTSCCSRTPCVLPNFSVNVTVEDTLHATFRDVISDSNALILSTSMPTVAFSWSLFLVFWLQGCCPH